MRFTLLLLFSLTACTPYIEAEMNLVTQARRGVALAAEAQTAHRELADQLHAIQRRRLDEAFDEDVRNRAELSADWIIDHRRAYVACVEALAIQQNASADSDRIARDNLRATDEALQRLEYLQSLRLNVATMIPSSP